LRKKIKSILIADDHPLLLIGLRGIIDTLIGYQLVGEATNGTEAVILAKKVNPDIAIIDLELPGINGIEVLKGIKKMSPAPKVAILTSHKEEMYLLQAIDAGADGYLLKDFANEEISNCLAHFENDEPYYSVQLKSFINPASSPDPNFEKLSRTERKILRLISQEKTSKEIGEILFTSPKTVDNHRSNIIKKLEITAKKHSLFSWASKHQAFL
jgi:DNA-binding NarL/FixJ family response regulator